MPRKSAASLAVTRTGEQSTPLSLAPGDHLPEPARPIFYEIVSSVASGFFSPTDRALIEQLAVALYVCRELATALVADGVIGQDGAPNQVGRHLRSQQQTVIALQTKLRLSKQARATKRGAAAAANAAPPSIAEIYENARSWQ